MDKRLLEAVDEAVRARRHRREGDEVRFQCPAHDDEHPSAYWNPQKGVWRCAACRAAGGTKDLAQRVGVTITAKPTKEMCWTIRNASGSPIAQHIRQDRPDGTKKFLWKRNGTFGLGDLSLEDLPLYGSDQLATALDDVVVVVEGEKSRDALIERGILACGTVTGANVCPSDASLAVLRGRTAILWADNDDRGFRHMAEIGDRLEQIGITTKWFTWNGAPPKGDAADFTGTTEELQNLLGTATTRSSSGTSTTSSTPTPSPLFVRAAEVDVPRPSYLVDGLLADGMLHILSGKDKRGKTLLAEEIGRCVVRGASLFGEFVVRQGTVLAALLDDPLAVTVDRLQRLGVREPGDNLFIVDSTRFHDPQDFLDELEAEAIRLSPSLIIIDALYLFTPTSRDAGNDAARMAPVMRRFDRLATTTGAAVLVVCHDAKSGQDVAGSYAVRAVAKVVMRLTLPKSDEKNADDDDGATITTRRILSCESKLVQSTTYTLELHDVGDWRFLGTPSAVRSQDVKARILKYLETGKEETAEEIAKAVRCRRADAEELLDELFLEHGVNRRKADTGSRGRPRLLYSCPKPGTVIRGGTDIRNGQDAENATEKDGAELVSPAPNPREKKAGHLFPEAVGKVIETFPGARVVEE